MEESPGGSFALFPSLAAATPNVLARGLLLRLAASILIGVFVSGCSGTSTAPVTPPPAPPPAPLQLELLTVATGLSSPVDLQQPSDGTPRLFVVEQAGRIRIIQNGTLLATPYLDIVSKVESGGEEGLLGLVFHPRFSQNGRFFVHYTRLVAGVIQHVISEFAQSSANPNLAASTERIMLIVPKTPTNQSNHNAGQMAFGSDGMFYAGFGDGGGGGDVDNNAQNPNTLLGKLIRIDVDATPPAGQAYVVPSDNPFLTRPALANTIWADGLRNPWRFSFDFGTSPARLFLADVGQGAWEEVDLITRGGNYGWRILEGTHCFNPANNCPTAGLTLPIFEYSHAQGDDSVTGGYVYRGTRIPQLAGTYVFGDFISGRIWGLAQDTQGVWVRSDLLQLGVNTVSSFGRDQAGELYILNYGTGSVLRFHQVGAP
jgi:glucose/arabinose dehydrogenase